MAAVYVVTLYNLNYSAEIAPTGQEASQAPQERQVSLSISYWESPCEIAFAGQPDAQVPQLMQLSEITYAIVKTSYMLCFLP